MIAGVDIKQIVDLIEEELTDVASWPNNMVSNCVNIVYRHGEFSIYIISDNCFYGLCVLRRLYDKSDYRGNKEWVLELADPNCFNALIDIIRTHSDVATEADLIEAELEIFKADDWTIDVV